MSTFGVYERAGWPGPNPLNKENTPNPVFDNNRRVEDRIRLRSAIKKLIDTTRDEPAHEETAPIFLALQCFEQGPRIARGYHPTVKRSDYEAACEIVREIARSLFGGA